MDKLHLMADALMKYETIDVGQIDAIMEGKVPDPPSGWNDDSSSGGGGPQSGSAVPVDDDKIVTDEKPPAPPSVPDPDPAS